MVGASIRWHRSSAENIVVRSTVVWLGLGLRLGYESFVKLRLGYRKSSAENIVVRSAVLLFNDYMLSTDQDRVGVMASGSEVWAA